MATTNVVAANSRDLDSQECSTQVRPTVNVGYWERVASMIAGGSMVLAGLSRGKLSGLLLTAGGAGLLYRGYSGHCSCYSKLGMDTSEHGANTAIPAGQGSKVQRSVTIQRPAEEVFAYWNRLENLSSIMDDVLAVEELSGQRSHWRVRGPLNQTLEWDAEIIERRSPEVISWRSVPGADVDTAGSVHFRPTSDGAGCVVTVTMKYNPAGGKLGAAAASALGDGLNDRLTNDLRKFKRVMEAGGGKQIAAGEEAPRKAR